jgi:hypothetical protein
MQFAMKASPAPRRCGSVTYRAEPFPWCGRSRTHAHRSQREDHHPRTLSFRFCSSECIFVALSARNAVMSSGARRLHSPVEACHRLQIGQPLRRSPQWSISTSGWSHCLQRLECISGPMLWGRMAFQTPEQSPDGPVPAHVPLPRSRLKRPMPWALLGPATALMRTARRRKRGRPIESRGERNVTSGINPAVAYSKPNRNCSAMAAGGHGAATAVERTKARLRLPVMGVSLFGIHK